MSGPSFTLLECAAGYALFEVVGFEEIGSLLEGSKDTVTDLKRFGRAVKLKGFMPFESAQMALENANAISEHAMTEDLHDFLEMNLPKKAGSYTLGVIDPGLATAISEGLGGVSCRSDDTVREIMRGCRMHLETFVKGLEGGAAEKAQLGLGHSYSRSKVKFNPARSDNMIIQSIALLDQMDKDLNTFAMRVREWYSWHFPELRDIVKDNIMFARAAAYIQDKSNLCHSGGGEDGDSDEKEDKLPGLIEIVGDEETAKAIQAAAKTSMGMDCSAIDMVNIVNFTQRMVKLAEFRKNLSQYLTDKMNVVAPNLSALIGDTVGARLISKVCNDCSVVHIEIYFQTLILTLLTLVLGWILDQLGKSACFYCADFGCRKSVVPCPQNQGKYTEVRSNLSFDVYRACRCKEQGSHISLLGQQVFYRNTHRLFF
jgi:nucleolar protein 56